MRYLQWLAGSFTLLSSLMTGVPHTIAQSIPTQDITLNVGHRGASGYAPEHTLAAYDLALRLGADYIEQDLQQTKEGILVVLHDETLDRTARDPAENCSGLVNTKTLCSSGGWLGPLLGDAR